MVKCKASTGSAVKGLIQLSSVTTIIESVLKCLAMFIADNWYDIAVIFHITTLMPYHADDTHFTEKKKHIGNDNVTIVYNDSGEEYRVGTIKVCLS